MTSVSSSHPTRSLRPDAAAIRRRFAGACLIVSGAALVAAFSMPHAERDDAVAFVPFVQSHSAVVGAVGVLSLVVVLTVIPGMAGLSAALSTRAPWLATVGAAFVVAGFASFLVIVGTDNATTAFAASGQSQPVVGALLDSSSNTFLYNAAFLLFVTGHLVGPLLIGIAAWRARFAPWPIAALAPVGAVGHFVAEAVGIGALDIAAFVVLGAGLAGLGVLLLRPSRTTAEQ